MSPLSAHHKNGHLVANEREREGKEKKKVEKVFFSSSFELGRRRRRCGDTHTHTHTHTSCSSSWNPPSARLEGKGKRPPHPDFFPSLWEKKSYASCFSTLSTRFDSSLPTTQCTQLDSNRLSFLTHVQHTRLVVTMKINNNNNNTDSRLNREDVTSFIVALPCPARIGSDQFELTTTSICILLIFKDEEEDGAWSAEGVNLLTNQHTTTAAAAAAAIEF